MEIDTRIKHNQKIRLYIILTWIMYNPYFDYA